MGIDLSREAVPDATTLLKFRRLLLDNDLTKALFEEINAHLAEQGLLMRAGTIVDATIIAAPSSTKNAGNTRDPEMHQTKKGNAWHFGMRCGRPHLIPNVAPVHMWRPAASSSGGRPLRSTLIPVTAILGTP